VSSSDLSIVIPIFNRGDVIRYTFESVRRASAGLVVETIVIDDGSAVPVAETMNRLGLAATRVIRQENRGLLFARLTGLAAATGRHILFLDSDDLITPDKLSAQVSAMDRDDADVSYTDTARAVLACDYDHLEITHDPPLRATTDAAEFFIDVQPAPHSPVFRRSYLEEIVRRACFPPSPLYNPVAEIWFYHVAAPRPARVVYVPGPRAIIGQHPDARLTNHWERLAVASLAVMEAFARSCPTDTSISRSARRLVGEKAFRSWRALPWDFSPEFGGRLLAVWRQLAAPSATAALGGRTFQFASRFVAPVAAGRLFRRWQNASYATCRTLTDAEIAPLLAALPPQQ
jgi:glycosyltransferase involved in cell wall biosynthesis